MNKQKSMCALLISILLLFLHNGVVMGAYSNTQTSGKELEIVPIAENLPKSWAIAVSPSNQLYMTERSGVLHQFAIDEKNTLAKLNLVHSIDLGLSDLYSKGQGGLLAIAFAPNYADTSWLYLSYSFGSDKANGLKVIRVKLEQDEVVEKELVFTQSDLRDTPVHYGGRMAFKHNGNLLLTTGDGFDYREQAQVKTSQLGKIIEVEPNGKTYIYSLGHRNPQALIILENGQVIAHEHGAQGGDEINIIVRGNNYGWPVITQGRDYLGGLITPFTEYDGMQQPDYDWTPSIAPSGMVLYKNKRISAFNNRLLVTSLKFKQLHSLSLSDDKKVSNERIHFINSGFRMRDITQTASGRVFILSDGGGNENSTIIFEVVNKQ